MRATLVTTTLISLAFVAACDTGTQIQESPDDAGAAAQDTGEGEKDSGGSSGDGGDACTPGTFLCSCEQGNVCGEHLNCVAGKCLPPQSDVGIPDAGLPEDTGTTDDTGAELDAGPDTGQDAGNDAGTADGGGGQTDAGFACAPSPTFMRDNIALELTVDVTRHASGVYPVKEKITVTADRDGCALTLFGEGFTVSKAGVPHDYDGHAATFQTGSFRKGDRVSVDVEFDVPASYEANGWGLHEWPGQSGELVVGPFNEPYFVPLWLFVPQSLFRVDKAHDDNVAFDTVKLSVVVPDASWTVAGPGGAGTKAGNSWSFAFTGPTPLYALSFAASPSYDTWNVGASASGVVVTGYATDASMTAARAIYPDAITTIDWMEQNIGPYDFGKVLALVDVPGLPGGMEHTTAIWFGSDVLVDNSDGRFVIVHETAHHWWGDSVRFADWPHFWLAEGFDEWSSNYNVMGLLESPTDFTHRKFVYRYYASEFCTQASSPLRFDDGDDMVDHFNGDLQQYYIWGAAALQQIDTHLKARFSSDLVTELRAWYAKKRLSSATTEEFRNFLADRTGDTQYWNDFFNDWILTIPCPTVQPSGWSYAGGTAQLTLNRVGGAGQDMPGIKVYFLDNNGNRTEATADLPRGTDKVTVQAQTASTPVRVVVDPDGAYVFRLKRPTGWSGPTVSLSFTPQQIPPPETLRMPDAKRWVRY